MPMLAGRTQQSPDALQDSARTRALRIKCLLRVGDSWQIARLHPQQPAGSGMQLEVLLRAENDVSDRFVDAILHHRQTLAEAVNAACIGREDPKRAGAA